MGMRVWIEFETRIIIPRAEFTRDRSGLRPEMPKPAQISPMATVRKNRNLKLARNLLINIFAQTFLALPCLHAEGSESLEKCTSGSNATDVHRSMRSGTRILKSC